MQVPIADAIRRDADIATMAVDFITDAHQAEAILENGKADMIVIALFDRSRRAIQTFEVVQPGAHSAALPEKSMPIHVAITTPRWRTTFCHTLWGRQPSEARCTR